MVGLPFEGTTAATTIAAMPTANFGVGMGGEASYGLDDRTSHQGK